MEECKQMDRFYRSESKNIDDELMKNTERNENLRKWKKERDEHKIEMADCLEEELWLASHIKKVQVSLESI